MAWHYGVGRRFVKVFFWLVSGMSPFLDLHPSVIHLHHPYMGQPAAPANMGKMGLVSVISCLILLFLACQRYIALLSIHMFCARFATFLWCCNRIATCCSAAPWSLHACKWWVLGFLRDHPACKSCQCHIRVSLWHKVLLFRSPQQRRGVQ